jgi:serine/threonine-protein kinase
MRVRILEAGTVVAHRYEIRSALGRGGMGYVYRARHLGLGKDVALKVLAPGMERGRLAPAVTGADAARFAREARAIARLDHPSCVRVLDHGHAGSSPYIAMELLEGESLAAALRAGRFELARAVTIARQLLSALVHAHGHGVIHRDIKPENVMLVKDGTRAVLIDFGLASLHDEPPLTAAGMCIGSPSYIAPERLLGKPHDTRTDLYAVGVILYEMLAGVRPFAGESPEHTMHLALHRPPRPLRALRGDLPASLDGVVTRALAKDPARRFADAEDMMLALVDAEAQPVDEEDADAADTCARLDARVPSLPVRLWTWLRYGGWRWIRRERT